MFHSQGGEKPRAARPLVIRVFLLDMSVTLLHVLSEQQQYNRYRPVISCAPASNQLSSILVKLPVGSDHNVLSSVPLPSLYPCKHGYRLAFAKRSSVWAGGIGFDTEHIIYLGPATEAGLYRRAIA
jgi:hypothetical protein